MLTHSPRLSLSASRSDSLVPWTRYARAQAKLRPNIARTSDVHHHPHLATMPNALCILHATRHACAAAGSRLRRHQADRVEKVKRRAGALTGWLRDGARCRWRWRCPRCRCRCGGHHACCTPSARATCVRPMAAKTSSAARVWRPGTSDAPLPLRGRWVPTAGCVGVVIAARGALRRACTLGG